MLARWWWILRAMLVFAFHIQNKFLKANLTRLAILRTRLSDGVFMDFDVCAILPMFATSVCCVCGCSGYLCAFQLRTTYDEYTWSEWMNEQASEPANIHNRHTRMLCTLEMLFVFASIRFYPFSIQKQLVLCFVFIYIYISPNLE